MDIKLFLIFLVIICVVQQGPVAYRGITWFSSGARARKYTKNTSTNYFTRTPDFRKTIGKEGILYHSLWNCVSGDFLLTCVRTTSWKALQRKMENRLFHVQGMESSSLLCRYCGTDPCQAKRASWKRFEPRVWNLVDFEKRSHAMRRFSQGLQLSVELTKELPCDELYWARKFCDYFEEEHLALFPLCVQRQINAWYPVPY
ncbi:uncharacterized protein [Argopecten irradians]|uniref:uncharacterized protein n=1 Tax=Argopecten irradians TaxID=31199 RepID=UPI0037145A96